MDLYYQNETLYVDVDYLLNSEDYDELKMRIFRIVEDYGVDNIIIYNRTRQFLNKQYFNRIKQEYSSRYNGRLHIK